MISIVRRIDRIEQQHDSSTGYKAPPVLPCELVKLRSHEFNKILDQQAERFLDIYSKDFLDNVESQHTRELLQAVRLKEPLRLTMKEMEEKGCSPLFTKGLSCIGERKFRFLKD